MTIIARIIIPFLSLGVLVSALKISEHMNDKPLMPGIIYVLQFIIFTYLILDLAQPNKKSKK